MGHGHSIGGVRGEGVWSCPHSKAEMCRRRRTQLLAKVRAGIVVDLTTISALVSLPLTECTTLLRLLRLLLFLRYPSPDPTIKRSSTVVT